MQDAVRRLELASHLSSVAIANTWVCGLGVEAGLNSDDIYRLELAIGELLTNLITYGFDGSGLHAVEICARLFPGEVRLSIVDDGRPFNPVEHPLGALATLSDESPPGGWGLRLVRCYTDSYEYERIGERNCSTFSIRRRIFPVGTERVAHRRGPDRRQSDSSPLFPTMREDGGTALVESRSGRDRRLLGFISRFEIFRGIPFHHLESTVSKCPIVRYPSEEILLRPGESNDAIAFVLAGHLRIHLDSPSSANFFLIEVGDCAGELSVIDGKPASAYVVAEAGTSVLLVNGETLFDALFAIPGVARKLMAILTGRLRRASGRMLTRQRASMQFEQWERDLRMAHDVQLGMLPEESTFFADRQDVDVAAGIRVARQVGGDFYDAYFVDPTHLFVMIGDVCGKGLPAALFMVRAMTQLRSESIRRDDAARSPLHEMIVRVNAVLLERNEASLFVTIFCAILDTVTGHLVYVNAGHCSPAIAAPEHPFRFLEAPRNPVVGIVERASFLEGSTVLTPGSILVLYTDGVTEALSMEREEFGPTRLLAALNEAERDATTLLATTLTTLTDFVDGEPQSDDIAMLVARFTGQL